MGFDAVLQAPTCLFLLPDSQFKLLFDPEDGSSSFETSINFIQANGIRFQKTVLFHFKIILEGQGLKTRPGFI
jgi:hypothetical protein